MLNADSKFPQNDHQNSESLFELAKILGQQNDFAEILRIVSLKISTLFNAEFASIMMINPRTQDTIKTILKEGKGVDQQRYQLTQTNIIGWVSKNKQAFLTADIKTDSRFRKGLFKDTDAGSAMCVPLQSEATTIGYLVVINETNNDKFNSHHLSFFEKLAAISAPFLSNVQKIQEYFNTPLPESALLAKYEPLGLLGKGQKFIELLKAIEAAARCDVRVLLEGQSGTGKELIARAIHTLSPRKDYPFVAIDCGAIPENLIESELFGHVKGAFTGATYDRKGLFEEAQGGSLLIDEVENLPFKMQSKLLRVLQEGEIRALGSNKPRKINVRIISASSGSLRNMVDGKQFREDLYYRLHVYPIYVPTLNERCEDIPILADYFLKTFARQQQKQAQSFHGSILRFMQQHTWSGHIRELENFVERLVTVSPIEKTVLDRDVLPSDFLDEFDNLTTKEQITSVPKPLQESMAAFEEQVIREALEAHNWNQSKAARALRISERTIRYKIERLMIKKPT